VVIALLVIADVKPLSEVQLAFLPKDVNDSQVLHCVNAKKYSLTTYKGLEVTIIL
jgi:hypothetical protein